MGYIIRLPNGRFDLSGFGQGEGTYNVTRVELETLKRDIECELMQDEFDNEGNPVTRIGG
jgi:hypothetical protein